MRKTQIVVRKVGHGWYGQAAAKAEETFTVGTGPFEVDVDANSADDVLSWVDAHEGDLADYASDVRVIVTETTDHKQAASGAVSVHEWTTTVTEHVLRAFTDEEEDEWSQCFEEEWEYEDA